MRSSNTIIKNYLFNLSYQMLSFIVPLITTPYISRVFTENEIGQYSYTHSIVIYFVLFGNIGLNLYGQREIAYNQKDVAEQKKIFYELIRLRLIFCALSTVLYIIFILSFKEYTMLFIIQIIDLIASALDISWLYQGREEFSRTVSIQSVVKILGTVAIFLFVHTPNDVVIYAGCLSVPLLLGNLLMWLNLKRIFLGVQLESTSMKGHLRGALLLFIPQVAIEVYTVLDKTMIGSLTGDTGQVGYYEQAQKIVKTVLVIVTSLSTVMLPRVSSVLKEKSSKNVYAMIYKSYKVVFMLSIPLACGLFIVSEPLIEFFLGIRYIYSAKLIQIICPIIIFIGLASVSGNQFLLPMNMQKEYTRSVIFGAVTNVLMNFILIPRYGAAGASIATVFSEGVVTSIQFYSVRDFFKLKVILKESLNYWISAFVMAVVLGRVAHINLPAIQKTLFEFVVGSTVYFCCLLILKDPLIHSIFRTLKEKTEK